MLHEYHLIYSSILRMWSDLDIVPSTGCFFRGGREFAPYRLQAAKPDRLGVQPLQCMCSTETINWVQLCNPKTPIHIKHLLNKTIVEWEISTFSGMFIIWTGDGITSVGWFASRKKKHLGMAVDRQPRQGLLNQKKVQICWISGGELQTIDSLKGISCLLPQLV